MVQALNRALHELMEDDERTIVLGEDVGPLGGVFRVTDGLFGRYGERRVIDTPLGESAIIGAAIGLAMRGFRPIVELQFDGLAYAAFDQIVSHLAKYHYRSGGRVTLPVTVRIPYGGGIRAVEHHSESPEAYYAQTAGLFVFAPSTPRDAYSLLIEAVRGRNPVVFFEPKHEYWSLQEDALAAAPKAGVAVTLLRGDDVTLVAYGPGVRVCMAAAEFLRQENRSIEVIDLRTLNPLDTDSVVQSVERTKRLVVVHEAPTFGGFGGEIAARVTERCFYSLVAPPMRVGSYSTPYPVAAIEDWYLPSVERVVDTVDECLNS